MQTVLDKYVTTATLRSTYIVSSHTQQSVNYIFFMIKYYNFSINKIYTSIEPDKDTIIDNIKKAKYVYETYKLFTDGLTEPYQCIKIIDMDTSFIH